jgi:hypothetical protein
MNSHALREIRDDVWYILLHLYSFQEISSRALASSSTRHELASEFVALNAISENIVMRAAAVKVVVA